MIRCKCLIDQKDLGHLHFSRRPSYSEFQMDQVDDKRYKYKQLSGLEVRAQETALVLSFGALGKSI